MYCPLKPLVKDFLNLIDSFNLVQFVSGPTQERGDALDLVLTNGFTVCNLEVCDALFSDHMPVVFDIQIKSNQIKIKITLFIPEGKFS